MIIIREEEIHENLDYRELIPAIREGFVSDVKVPPRHHHDFRNPKENNESTLLMMPSWQEGTDLGVKVVTVSPSNSKYNLPAIHGLYLLFDAHKGEPLAMLDARALTTHRTAATSALASSFLSAEDSRTLLMVGTGALAPELIKAHCTVRDIKNVLIWGRDYSKAEQVAQELDSQFYSIHPVRELDENLPKADIVSCATLSSKPLIHGNILREGAHVDLVGAYRKDMREADDEVLTRSRIYVDSREMAPRETGDLFIPLEAGVISENDIRGDLFQLCRGEVEGRTSPGQNTVFKSVGHALEDLVAARLVMKKML